MLFKTEKQNSVSTVTVYAAKVPTVLNVLSRVWLASFMASTKEPTPEFVCWLAKNPTAADPL